MKDEKNTMAQWMNQFIGKSFINRMQLPLLYEKSKIILLVLVGLTVGRPAVRRNTGRFGNF